MCSHKGIDEGWDVETIILDADFHMVNPKINAFLLV